MCKAVISYAYIWLPGIVLPALVSASSIQKIKAMDTFDIEEAEREWVTVHRGSVVMVIFDVTFPSPPSPPLHFEIEYEILR